MKLLNKNEFERKLNVSVVGLIQAKKNRTRIINLLGDTYHTYAGKKTLWEMYQIKHYLLNINTQ